MTKQFWLILLLTIVMVAGFAHATRDIPERCIFSQDIKCRDFMLSVESDGTLNVLAIIHNYNEPMIFTSGTAKDIYGEGSQCYVNPAELGTDENSQVNCTIPGEHPSMGNKLKTEVELVYIDDVINNDTKILKGEIFATLQGESTPYKPKSAPVSLNYREIVTWALRILFLLVYIIILFTVLRKKIEKLSKTYGAALLSIYFSAISFALITISQIFALIFEPLLFVEALFLPLFILLTIISFLSGLAGPIMAVWSIIRKEDKKFWIVAIILSSTTISILLIAWYLGVFSPAGF